jgi:two-component system, sensor histidine kinase and response regulator
MDGYEAARRIRAEGRFADLPIIALTAHALEEERQKVLEVGMNDQISKPIDPELLFDTLCRYYHKSRALPDQRIPALALAESRVEATAHGIPGNLQIPGIDVAGGLKRVVGNEKLYMDLLRKFVEGQEGAVLQIGEALKNKDLGLAESLAHLLRGISGNIGATGVQTAAEEFEDAAGKSQAEGRLEEIRQRLALVLEATVAHIRTALPEPAVEGKTVASEPISLPELAGILQKLINLAEENDTKTARYLETVRDDMSAHCPREDVERLESALKTYDFPAALRILKARLARTGEAS